MKFSALTALSLVLTLLLADLSKAQCSEEETDLSPYYYRKASLFDKLENDPNEIIFLGDSITDGGSWVEMFNNDAIKNRGISGDITQGVWCRIDEVIESKPKKIFIMIGINDLARDIPVDEILANYDKILEKIDRESPDTKLYIQSLLPVNPDFDMFENHMEARDEIPKVNKGLEELSDQYDAVFINLYPEFATEEDKLNPEFTNDGLHLTGEGYMAWQPLIEEYVSE